MATAYSLAQVTSGGGVPVNYDPTTKPGGGMLTVRKAHLNFDKIETATGVTLAIGDTFQVFKVKKGEVIIEAGINVLTGASAGCDWDLGFTGGGANVYGLVDGVEGDDTSFTVKAARGALLPLYMYADDTVDLLNITADASSGIVDVWMLVFRRFGEGV
jgi:hypothetical protein